jgi:hypothetical protein
MLGTLKRAGDVLDLFTTEEPEWGVTAVARRLEVGKSLAYDVYWTYMSIRGQSQAAPGAARMSSYLRKGPLSLNPPRGGLRLSKGPPFEAKAER